jgi:hypothetical protein
MMEKPIIQWHGKGKSIQISGLVGGRRREMRLIGGRDSGIWGWWCSTGGHAWVPFFTVEK